MYDSGIKCSDYIDSVIAETDISAVIPTASWYRWLSVVEQFLYSEVINECLFADIEYSDITDDKITLSSLTVPSGCAAVTYDDVVSVFADGRELERSGAKGMTDFSDKDLYYTDYSGVLILNPTETPYEIRIIYRLKPLAKAQNSTANVMIPIEFIDMAGARMRGEAYKIANEDGLAGKWLADYNTQLESFKIWAQKRNERYGG